MLRSFCLKRTSRRELHGLSSSCVYTSRRWWGPPTMGEAAMNAALSGKKVIDPIEEMSKDKLAQHYLGRTGKDKEFDGILFPALFFFVALPCVLYQLVVRRRYTGDP